MSDENLFFQLAGLQDSAPFALAGGPCSPWTGDEGELPQKSAERTDETVQLSKNTASKPESEPAVDKEAELPPDYMTYCCQSKR